MLENVFNSILKGQIQRDFQVQNAHSVKKYYKKKILTKN